MSAFDAILIGGVISCIICLIQLFPNDKKLSTRIIFGTGFGILLVTILGTCFLAKHYNWESAILAIPKAVISDPSESNLSINYEEVVATIKMKESFPVSNCPELNIEESVIYKGQNKYKLMWKQFEDRETYKVAVYELDGENHIPIFDEVVSGYSYLLDVSVLKSGKTYSVNISVDDIYYSVPAIIEMLP